MKITAAQKISLIIPYTTHQKLEHWIKKATGEITGYGVVKYDSENSDKIIVEDVFLGKQETSRASATIETMDTIEIMQRIEKKNIPLEKMKLWWHSHADMDVFWSTTDETTINSFDPDSFFVSLVLNKAGDMLARFDLYHPIRVVLDDISIFTSYPELDKRRKEKYDKEFDMYVDESTYYSYSYPGGFFEWDFKTRKYVKKDDKKKADKKTDYKKGLYQCLMCGGKGYTNGYKCIRCDGEGYVNQKQSARGE